MEATAPNPQLVRRPAGPASPPQTAGQPRPLRLMDVTFSDLYIVVDPLQDIMVRDLARKDAKMGQIRKGLLKLPAQLDGDVQTLHDKILRKYAHSNHAREFNILHDAIPYRVSLVAPPSQAGETVEKIEWVVRRVMPRIPSLDDLNASPWVKEDALNLTELRGLVLVGGAFGSGKTTLASSLFDGWVTRSREVGIAMEDPPELITARASADRGKIISIDLQDRSIRQAIKNSRRWAPRYVFLGELRTPEVTIELLNMAISGPLTICTIHGSDAIQSVIQLIRYAAEAMGEEVARRMVANCLKHVFHTENTGGRFMMRSCRLHGPENSAILAKIKAGDFKSVQEDLERQAINRSNAKKS